MYVPTPNVVLLRQEILQLEQLCKSLYETADPAVRNEAEKALVDFPNSPDCLAKCQLLLERAAVSCDTAVILSELVSLHVGYEFVNVVLDALFPAAWGHYSY